MGFKPYVYYLLVCTRIATAWSAVVYLLCLSLRILLCTIATKCLRLFSPPTIIAANNYPEPSISPTLSMQRFRLSHSLPSSGAGVWAKPQLLPYCPSMEKCLFCARLIYHFVPLETGHGQLAFASPGPRLRKKQAHRSF